MALVGYNAEEVNNAINNVQSGYNTLIRALTTVNQDSFIDAFANIWASEQAQTFFGAYKTDISNLVEGINKIYESIVDAMNKAASILASTSGSTWANKVFEQAKCDLNVEVIKDNLNGVKGIDLDKAPDVLKELDSILVLLKAGLLFTKSAVDSSGFVGGGMQEQLILSIKNVEENINTAFDDIKVSVNSAIQETVNAYSMDATKISEGFTSE